MNYILITLLFTHITIICVTLYLHRGQTHRGIVFHPILSHFMRAWLWLTTGINTKEWVAIHRKHHRYSDVAGDPHSPHIHGLWQVLFRGTFLYRAAAEEREMVKQYGVGTPDDWVERNVYTAYAWLGIIIMLLIDVILFGACGILIWVVQMMWIPLHAAGIINGLAHWWGYRTANTDDKSTNLTPWAIWIGGEELHNSHHSDPASPKFSKKWWEFDIGWMWLSVFRLLGLAKLNIRS